jgi:hypothetical protein
MKWVSEFNEDCCKQFVGIWNKTKIDEALHAALFFMTLDNIEQLAAEKRLTDGLKKKYQHMCISPLVYDRLIESGPYGAAYVAAQADLRALSFGVQ